MTAHDSEPDVPELAALPREMAPPAALEERIVGTLRRERLLRGSGSRGWLRLAAGLALFVTGAGAGALLHTPASPVAPRGPRYIFLLYGAATAGGSELDRVAAYGRWASDVRASGRYITGERLARHAVPVPDAASTEAGAAEIQGYFVVSAADLTDARRVAADSPHVRFGGRIVIRPIDTP